MSVKDFPHFTVSSEELAGWIDRQPDRWWAVDGDPWLMSNVDFPCPSDELAPALRQRGGELVVYDKTPNSRAHGEAIKGDKLDELCDFNWRRLKRLLFAWVGTDLDWLLVEDEALVQK